MHRKSRILWITVLILVTLALLLSACGGGGSGGKMAATKTPGGPTETPCGCSEGGDFTQPSQSPFQQSGVVTQAP